MMNNNILKEKDAWEGFPEILKNMLLTVYHSNGDYCVGDAVRFLQVHKVNKSERRGDAKLEYLRWIDRFFTYLYPMTVYEGCWTDYAEDLEDLLICAEGYLRDLAGDYDSIINANKDESGYKNDNDLVNFAQNLDIHFCTLYWFENEQKKFVDKLDRVLTATKKNMLYVLSHEDSPELMAFDFKDQDGFSFDVIYWQNISIIYREGAELFTDDLIPIYERYISFMSELVIENKYSQRVRDNILRELKNDLSHLYEMSIDDDIPF